MYSFYLGSVRLPTPGKMTTKIKGANKAMALVNEQEINILKHPRLTEVSFEVYLDDPTTVLLELERLMVARKPTQLIVSRGVWDTNLKVSLESYDIIEDATQGPGITVKINLKQHVAYATKVLQVTNTKATAVKAQRPGKPENPATYTVKSGDTLWIIAKRFYGDGSKYKQLAKANGIVNPNLIYPGQVLKL